MQPEEQKRWCTQAVRPPNHLFGRAAFPLNATHRRRQAGVSLTAALVLAPLLALLLAACTESKAPPRAPAFQGTLTVLFAPGFAGYTGPADQPDPAWLQERARAYEAAHPGVSVTLRSLPSPAALEQALRSGSEAAPDLAFGRFLPDLAPRLADLVQLLPAEVRSDLLPGAAEGFTAGGTMRGLPALVEVPVLALNEKAFAAAGVSLPAGDPLSGEQFTALLQKLSGPGRYGLGFYVLPGYHEWWPLAGGLISPEGRISAGAGPALERLQEYRTQGLLHPDTAKVTAEATWRLFSADPPAFAIMPAPAWAIPLLRAEPYNVKLSVAGFPGGAAEGYVYGFSVFAASESVRTAAAADLALFLAAPDQLVRLSRSIGLMPARRQSGNPFEGDPAMTQAWQLAGNVHPLPAGGAWEQAELKFTPELRYAVLGGRPAAEALENAAHLVESVSAAAGSQPK